MMNLHEEEDAIGFKSPEFHFKGMEDREIPGVEAHNGGLSSHKCHRNGWSMEGNSSVSTSWSRRHKWSIGVQFGEVWWLHRWAVRHMVFVFDVTLTEDISIPIGITNQLQHVQISDSRSFLGNISLLHKKSFNNLI